MRSILITAAVLTLAVLAAGCGDSKPTAAEAEARLCS